MASDTSEKAFQADIIAHLVSTGYHSRGTHNYSKSACIDPELVLKFVKETQGKEWKKFESLYNSSSEDKFLYRLVKEIETKSTIHVLRNGFKDVGCHFDLFYPRPNNSKNPDLFAKYEKNIFSVVDELEYENKEKGNRLDLVIFVNGLPIITIELKDTFSQGVERAIKQYENDRDPRENIFQRCLVHFAVSDEKIFMATKLGGSKTRFLPFNRGLENPEVPNDYKTSYLYNDILQKNKLSKLLSNYIYFDLEDDIIIFPRFHQLDCVNCLLEEAKCGKNYLIEHSAGSGKTKTIAWLSHGLINKFDKNDERVYNMVIVVSDRKVIDKQLQDQVKQIEKVKGIVEKIDKDSEQLKEALKTGSNIVVTTIQKFPYLLEEMGRMPKRKYAVVIDEAHSSQAGENAKALKRILAVNSLEEAESLDNEGMDKVDEELLTQIEKAKNIKNISFFAFTATPKNKTLELFGCPKLDSEGKAILNKNGEPKLFPFHLYTMKQAIEEGFILDVLKFYLTYETYFKLVKRGLEDKEYDERKAKKLLRGFVEKHPTAIAKKTEIILTHFMSSTVNKIKGKGKAMVVTRSRLHAVLYKKAFDQLIKEQNYPIKTLVAFSGIVEHDTQEYTENSMNNLPSRKTIVDAFEEDDYRVLIVANKFQTGFDQPKLHTMYIDKVLNGIAAVQTLSRANRPILGSKEDTLILDFANRTEVIEKAFKPYYQETYLSERTDPHKLYELQDKLLNYEIFEEDDVENFVKSLLQNSPQPKLHALLNPVVDSFRGKGKKDQVEFKKTLKRYQNIYSFLSQLIPFSDLKLEKLYIFNKYLQKKLPTINNPLPFSVLQDVDMDSYKVVNKGQKAITLREDGELKPITAGVGEYAPEINEKLSKIIKDLNEAFATDFTEDDKVFLGRVKDHLLSNYGLLNKLKNNSKENVKAVFDKYFNEEMTKLLNSDMKFYKKVVDNPKLRSKLKSSLFDLVYYEYAKRKEDPEATKLPPDKSQQT